MRTKLLNLAFTERDTLGYITSYTRHLLGVHGVTSVELEQYLSIRSI